MRPPQRSRASRIVTLRPARASSRPALRPAAPAPTTMMCAALTGSLPVVPAALSHLERHRADLVDRAGERVAGLDLGDAVGRAGQDHVAGMERVDAARAADQVGNVADQLACVRLLAR